MKTRLAVAVMAVLVVLVLAVPGQAQRREFLTDVEIGEIREAQDPNQRLKLYTQYAQTRLEQVEKFLAGSETNRASSIHDLLYEFDKIIEAIEMNADQADRKRNPMRKGLEYSLKNQPDFLKALESIKARNPKDIDEYRFVLEQAIDNTRASIESLQEVLQKQPKGKPEKEKKEKEAKQDAGERAVEPGARGVRGERRP